MTATNHALTGTVIGLAIGNPWTAIPLAFLSHFICDAIPHFGSTRPNGEWIASKPFKIILFSDMVACMLLVAILAWFHPEHWVTASFAAFAATSPDFMWLSRFVKLARTNQDFVDKDWNIVRRFHKWIQWFERPIGAFVELAWASIMIVLII